MGASITIPSQTLSVRQIMDRYRRGMPLEGRIKQPVYHNGEFPDLTNLDLSEIAALKRAAAQQVKDYQEDLQHQEQAEQRNKERAYQNEIETLKNQLKEKESAVADFMGTRRSLP